MLVKKLMGSGSARSGGFSNITMIIILLTVATGCGSWCIYQYSHRAVKPLQNHMRSGANTGVNSPNNPYSGWKVATSARALFSIKYPADWTYANFVGDKDNVEHITISSPNFRLTIDSYLSGSVTTTKCTDCLQTNSVTAFSIQHLGNINLETIVYRLDKGKGNALILRQPNETYYISPPGKPDVRTTFRGISNLPTLTAYQQETYRMFTANADFATAQMVFKSITY